MAPEAGRAGEAQCAALFGIGWGIAGFCPGPAIAAPTSPGSRLIPKVIDIELRTRFSKAFGRQRPRLAMPRGTAARTSCRIPWETASIRKFQSDLVSRSTSARSQLACLSALPKVTVPRCECAIRSAGKRKVTVVPMPTSLCISIDPPCNSSNDLVSGRPSPVPSC